MEKTTEELLAMGMDRNEILLHRLFVDSFEFNNTNFGYTGQYRGRQFVISQNQFTENINGQRVTREEHRLQISDKPGGYYGSGISISTGNFPAAVDHLLADLFVHAMTTFNSNTINKILAE